MAPSPESYEEPIFPGLGGKNMNRFFNGEEIELDYGTARVRRKSFYFIGKIYLVR